MLAPLAFFALLVQSDYPKRLVTPARLTCKEWAEVANYFIDEGEADASAELLRIAGTGKGKANVRVCLICRILFQPKSGQLRRPALGDLSLPSVPQSSWPEYPLFQQDGVWFELDENYRPGGNPELASKYIDYCQSNGRFRKDKLPVPTHEQAMSAYGALQGTKRWRAIPWSDSDLHSSYTYDRGWTLDLLRSQTHFSDSP